MEEFYLYSYAVTAAAVLIFAVWEYVLARRRNVKVPTLGSSGLLSSYYDAFRWLVDPNIILYDGYEKFKDRPFKVALLSRWQVMVSSRQHVEDISRAPDSKLSFLEAISDAIAIDWTLGPSVHHNSYHIPIIRSQLTRNLGVLFDDLKDEITEAFNDIIPPTEEWAKRPALGSIMQIICRTSNRLFVGLPLCRNPDYIKLNIEFTVFVANTALIVNRFPPFLRPLVGRFMSTLPKSTTRAMKHLGPIIEDRKRKYLEYGKDYPDKPNDMLTWFMEDEGQEGFENTVKGMSIRMLAVNFAAIHTTSMTFTHALLHLASKTEYMEPLREEVESVIRREGWTRAALNNMRKLDSFMKESQRCNSITVWTLTRKALDDFTFSDGTFLPKGSFVAAPLLPIHHDGAKYENADVFDGFRFANMREEDGEGVKHQMVSTNPEYLSFGHGRQACPGRFFAVNELKALMAYIVVTYDVKMEREGVRPDDECRGVSRIPNSNAEIMFRKRQK